MKRKMRFDEVLKVDWYRSIIRLTVKFQHKENGLRKIHYRWALIKNHDDIPERSTYFKVTMEKFFEGDLEDLYKKGTIIKDCVTSKTNLGNFIKKLVEMDVLLPIHSEDCTRYIIPPKVMGVIHRDSVKNTIDYFDPNYIHLMSDLHKVVTFKNLNGDDISGNAFGTFFGMPTGFYKQCDDEDKKLVAYCYRNIYSSAVTLYNFLKSKDKSIGEIGFYVCAGEEIV